MCEDCKERLRLNPMRILDCKVEHDHEIGLNAPKMRDFLSEEADARFYQTLSILNDMEIEYEIDDSLVRGLDYYGHIVFEVHAISPSGKDYGALLGGGHYDGMLANFNGPKDYDHGVGFAMGVERIYSLMEELGLLKDVSHHVDIYAMPIGEEVLDDGFHLVQEIRSLGYSVEMPFVPSKLGSMFKKAERSQANFALIFGTEDLQKGVVQLKNLKTHEQKEAKIENLDEILDAEFEKIDDEEENCCHEHHHEGD